MSELLGTQLLDAAYHHQFEVVKSLTEAGVDVNYVSSVGETAILMTAYCGSFSNN